MLCYKLQFKKDVRLFCWILHLNLKTPPRQASDFQLLWRYPGQNRRITGLICACSSCKDLIKCFCNSGHMVNHSSPFHADPRGIKNSHQPLHGLQDIPYDVWGHAQRADFWERLGLNVAHSIFCFLYKRFDLWQLNFDSFLSLLQFEGFFSLLLFKGFHFTFWLAGTLCKWKQEMWWTPVSPWRKDNQETKWEANRMITTQTTQLRLNRASVLENLRSEE